MGNKKKTKMGIKKKKTFMQIVAIGTLSQFSKMSYYCKSNVSAYQSCTIEQSFGWKRNYRHTY